MALQELSMDELHVLSAGLWYTCCGGNLQSRAS